MSDGPDQAGGGSDAGNPWPEVNEAVEPCLHDWAEYDTIYWICETCGLALEGAIEAPFITGLGPDRWHLAVTLVAQEMEDAAGEGHGSRDPEDLLGDADYVLRQALSVILGDGDVQRWRAVEAASRPGRRYGRQPAREALREPQALDERPEWVYESEGRLYSRRDPRGRDLPQDHHLCVGRVAAEGQDVITHFIAAVIPDPSQD